MKPDFWKSRRVLVTGHTGFKGSWLCLWLKSKEAHVIGYSLEPPTQPSLFEMAHVAHGMPSVLGDVRDLEHLHRVIAEHQPEIVFHMAAQSLVRRSYANPLETFSTNILGTVNVLEAVRHSCTVKVLVNVTSDKCYENREWLWGYRESEPMGGRDPYSSSKGCAELVTEAYRRSYFSNGNNLGHCVSVATARAGNVIGGGDWASDRLIPDIIKAMLDGRPVVIRNPNAVRPWQHVLEPLHGYLMLAESLWENGNKFAGAWNFGPNDDDARPVFWVADHMTNLWGGGACWVLDGGRHPHEAGYLKLDCSKAKAVLGWSPRLPLSTALRWVVLWYRAYGAGEDVRRVTEEQISSYERVRPRCDEFIHERVTDDL